MVICIFGESCTGKSTIANELSNRTNAKVYAGKDYLKLAKSEAEARAQFVNLMRTHESGDEFLVFVVTEKEHLSLLPPKALRILVTADIEIIKERFAQRMNGNLPPPVSAMLEKKHGMFDDEPHDLHVDNSSMSISDACDRIMALCG